MKHNRSRKPSRSRRRKISTTVNSENYTYLLGVAHRRSTTLAEVVDSVIDLARRLENRRLLEQQTAEYFEKLTGEALREEQELEQWAIEAAGEVDFERG